MENITIIGSTGSIGTQSLDVIRHNPDKFSVYGLCAGKNVELLIQQAKEFHPKVVGCIDETAYKLLKSSLPSTTEIICSIDAPKIISSIPVDNIICGIVGMAGLDSFFAAINNSKKVSLANKESLVCGGELTKDIILKNGVTLLPVDSEHSAIFQCLQGEHKKNIDKLIITASGGPFCDLPKADFSNITVERALKHPNWTMGAKITIDSATLMNKGLEVIEAVRLFDVDPSQIDVLVHKQSVIHSMVQFVDGSVMGQLGNADMRVPIQYALTYPDRAISNIVKPLDLAAIGRLDFQVPDLDKFPCLSYAFSALRMGGLALSAINAANECAVSLFLNKKIDFSDIPKLVNFGLNNYEDNILNLENIFYTHESIVNKIKKDYQFILKQNK